MIYIYIIWYICVFGQHLIADFSDKVQGLRRLGLLATYRFFATLCTGYFWICWLIIDDNRLNKTNTRIGKENSETNVFVLISHWFRFWSAPFNVRLSRDVVQAERLHRFYAGGCPNLLEVCSFQSLDLEQNLLDLAWQASFACYHMLAIWEPRSFERMGQASPRLSPTGVFTSNAADHWGPQVVLIFSHFSWIFVESFRIWLNWLHL